MVGHDEGFHCKINTQAAAYQHLPYIITYLGVEGGARIFYEISLIIHAFSGNVRYDIILLRNFLISSLAPCNT